MEPAAPFADHLGGATPEQWDALAGDQLYSSSAWLRFCVADPGGDTTTGGLHAELPGGGRAAVPVTAVRRENNGFYAWSRQLEDRGLPAPGPVGLLVGQRRGYRTHLLASPGAEPGQVAKVLLDGLRELRHGAASGPLAGAPAPVPAVGMFMTTPDVLALRSAGVTALPVALAAEAVIPLPAGDWAAWLDSLPSRRRADLIRRERRRFAAAGYEVVESTLSDCYRVAAELLAGTQARYGQPADLDLLTESFRVQGAAMGPAARVVLAQRDGQPPVGFCLFYLWGDGLYLRAAGFDYARLADAAEYFNLVYHVPINIALAAGKSWVYAGIEAEDAKALRGAELHPLWLLDLSEPSPLEGVAATVRAHNARYLEELTASSTAVAKALARDAWLPYC